MKKKYMKWTGVLIAIMFLATMLSVEARDNQVYELERIEEIKRKEAPEFGYEITDVLSGMSVTIDYDPELPEGGIPPMGSRLSFFYMTGMYQEYEGVNRLVGVWYNTVVWFDGIRHNASLTGLVALEIVEGEYAGSYVFTDWFFRWSWYGTPSIFPLRVSIGYRWNPDENNLGYFHCFADYVEDDEHIRYVSRTFTEDWSTPMP